MRVNVDEMALREPKIYLLAKRLGINRHEALGRIIHVWMLCYHRRCAIVRVADIDIAADLDGFAEAMTLEDLATPDDGGLYVRGVSERIGFLEQQANKGRKSGESRRSKSSVNQTPNQSQTDVEQRFKSGSTNPRTYSPDLDQAPDLDQSLRAESPEDPGDVRQVVTVNGDRGGIPQDGPGIGVSLDPVRSGKIAARANGEAWRPVARPLPDPPEEALTCAWSLLEYVTKNNPDTKLGRAPEHAKTAVALKWGEEIRKLHALDSIPYPAISAMIHWCQREHFWRTTVMSAEGLRKHWDRMAAQRQRGTPMPMIARGDDRKRRAEMERQRIEEYERAQAAARDRVEVRAALREQGFIPPDDEIPDTTTDETDPEPVQGSTE